MYRLIYFITLFLLNLVFSNEHAQATESRVAIDYIRGEGSVQGIKIAYQYHTNALDEHFSNLRVYLESSVNFWQFGEHNQYDSNFVLAISPVFSYELGLIAAKPVLVEFGIGLSLLDDTQFAGKNISTHYQFEDRLGLLYQFGKENKYSAALRYFHYSNGGIKKPNPGLDFISFSFAKKF